MELAMPSRVYAAKFFALLSALACSPPPDVEEVQQALIPPPVSLTVKALTNFDPEWDLMTIWQQHPPSAAEGCQPVRISVTNINTGVSYFRNVVNGSGQIVDGHFCRRTIVVSVPPGNYNVGVYPICANGTHYGSWTTIKNFDIPTGATTWAVQDLRDGPLAQKAKWRGFLTACGRDTTYYNQTCISRPGITNCNWL